MSNSHDGPITLGRRGPCASELPPPLLKGNLPFSPADSVVASVDVAVIGESLPRGAMAGLCLTNPDGAEFTVHKMNVDGYFVLAPDEADFIGTPGQEGDPGKYTVKYWPH